MADTAQTSSGKRTYEERNSLEPENNTPNLKRVCPPTEPGPSEEGATENQLASSGAAMSTAKPRSKLTCFRISGIPVSWNKDDLVRALRLFDPDFKDALKLSLFPACSGRTLTALLRLDPLTCSDYFRRMESRQEQYELIQGDPDIYLVIDRHFLGLTPLNAAGDDVLVDVVAVTGLAGHAFGSWCSNHTGCMWLQDLLPADLQSIRVMTYGYNSSLTRDTVEQTFVDYRRSFIHALMDARSKVESRPIIFIGHSMGGILILQVLLQAKARLQYRSLFDCTKAISFFATPHQGLYVKQLLEMAHDTGSGSKTEFIKQLNEGSYFLDTQREDISSLWESVSDIEIATFYEIKRTPTVSKGSSGSWARDGEDLQMVNKNSAMLFWPFEHRIPVDCNHRDIVKFSAGVDSTYRSVVNYMTRWVDSLQRLSGRGTETLSQRAKSKAQKILDWFFLEDIAKRHENLSDKRRDGIGTWALSTPEFSRWLGGDSESSSLLWVAGIAGSGKTYFSSLVVDHLFESFKASGSVGVSYIYFDYKERDHQRPIDIMSSVIKQLAGQLPQFPNKLVALYDECTGYQRRPDIKELRSLLLQLAKLFTRSFIVLDALDECDQEDQREALLPLFHQLKTNGFNLLVTSRPHPIDIQDSFRDVPCINYMAQDKDIKVYIDNRIDMMPRAKGLIRGSKIEDQFISNLISAANGVILFISLNVDFLCQQPTRHDILAELSKIRSAGDQETRMDRTYDRIMTSIRAQNPRSVKLAIKILTWLVAARRLLTLQELQDAVAIKLGHNELDKDRVPPPAIILDTCCGLVMIDEISKEVRLTHFTVHQYLLKEGIIADDMHQIIARASLTYLSFDLPLIEYEVVNSYFSTNYEDVMIDSDSYEKCVGSHPLLEYIAISLSYHLTFDELKTLPYIREFLSEPKQTTIYLQVLYQYIWMLKGDIQRSVLWRVHSQIHIATFIGHRAMVEYILLHEATSIESRDHNGNTPLHIAAACGKRAIASLLLEGGANIEAQDVEGWRALDKAITADHPSIVRLLCEHNAGIHHRGVGGQSPLLSAARGRKKDILPILIEHGANSEDGHGGDLLHIPVTHQDEECVGYLLDIGVDINSIYSGSDLPEFRGQTALHIAARASSRFISYLIGKGADIESLDQDNCTPLHKAAACGNLSGVQTLVDSGANIHCEDNRGLTVLHLAAESGDESVVEYLLSKGCEIDSQDLHGRTALHCITILNSYYRDDSDRDDWSLNMYQETARTKRHPSTRIRKECVFGFLIERGANLELSDNDGNTPLLLAARVSHPGIIQTLLFHGADNNAQNNLLHTALHWAAGRDDEAMIDVLLSHGASHRALDHQQFTPLHWAAYTGSEAAAKLLIKAGADVTSGHIDRQSPLDFVEAVLKEVLRPICFCSCKTFLQSENFSIASESIYRSVSRNHVSNSLGERERTPFVSIRHFIRGHRLHRLKLERTRNILIEATRYQSPPPSDRRLSSAGAARDSRGDNRTTKRQDRPECQDDSKCEDSLDIVIQDAEWQEHKAPYSFAHV